MSNTQIQFEAIGTNWTIDYWSLPPDIDLNKLEKTIRGRIEKFDKDYSRFRKDSLVWKISQSKGSYNFSEDSKILFDLYKKFYDLSDGVFTPLIGQVLSDRGYDAEYSLKPNSLPVLPPKWDQVMDFKYPQLEVFEPILLDFGAMGKGFLIDIVGEITRKYGVSNYCIDAGGDILVRSDDKALKPFRVGLEHPLETTQVIGVLQLLNQSVCASSGNRRKWDKYHHIIDGKSLESANKLLSSWVVAESTILADALATALFLVPLEKLQTHFSFEYLLLYPDLTFLKSNQFPGEVFLQ